VLGHDLWTLALGLGAGVACGFLNAAAAAGSAVSLPILMFIGLDPVSANATNRIPVLLGAISATLGFQAKKAISWPLALKVVVPTTLGSVAGAVLAELLPGRDLGLLITAAVLLALVLLFGKLKNALERGAVGTIRYGWREIAILFGIGIWLGFIVLDGATFTLLTLTLVVGLDLAPANAIKSLVLTATTCVAMVIFAYLGSIDWIVGAIMGAGSVVGASLGVRVATSANAKKHVFRLLVVVISAELVQLVWHYVFKTQG
jgi:uncharacterized membrane protein YfcA